MSSLEDKGFVEEGLQSPGPERVRLFDKACHRFTEDLRFACRYARRETQHLFERMQIPA